jgi:pilus assembly protein Flp/PilA
VPARRYLSLKVVPNPWWAGTPTKELHMLTTYEFVAAWLRSKTDSERGASLVEYALLLALIAIVCIIALQFLGEQASERFNSVGDSLDNGN